jgi:hypothetical protein
MRRLLAVTVAVMVACVALGLAGCGGSPSSPSAQPQLIQGTISLLAGGGDVVNFTATRAGTLSASVNWTSAENDVDIFLVKANCSVANLVAESAGCAESDTVASDERLVMPAIFSTAVTTGPYTLILSNFSSASESATYRLEIN